MKWKWKKKIFRNGIIYKLNRNFKIEIIVQDKTFYENHSTKHKKIEKKSSPSSAHKTLVQTKCDPNKLREESTLFGRNIRTLRSPQVCECNILILRPLIIFRHMLLFAHLLESYTFKINNPFKQALFTVVDDRQSMFRN